MTLTLCAVWADRAGPAPRHAPHTQSDVNTADHIIVS